MTDDEARDNLLGLGRLFGDLPLDQMVAYANPNGTLGALRWRWLCICARNFRRAYLTYMGLPEGDRQ